MHNISLWQNIRTVKSFVPSTAQHAAEIWNLFWVTLSYNLSYKQGHKGINSWRWLGGQVGDADGLQSWRYKSTSFWRDLFQEAPRIKDNIITEHCQADIHFFIKMQVNSSCHRWWLLYKTLFSGHCQIRIFWANSFHKWVVYFKHVC